MNKTEWVECATILATFYPHNFQLGADLGNDEASARIAQGQMMLWYHALADLPGPRVKAAVWSMVRSQPAFPSVADIRRLAEGNADAAAEAWDEAMRLAMGPGIVPEHVVSNPGHDAPSTVPSDPLIAKTLKALGGIRELAFGPSERLPTIRAQFLKLYQGFAQEIRRQATFEALGVDSTPLPLGPGHAADGPQSLGALLPGFTVPPVKKEQPDADN